jgi:hypothetical protein
MQSTIHNPQITTEVLAAMQAASLGNNGYADVPCLSPEAVSALRAAGYGIAPSRRVYHNGHKVAKPGVELPGTYYPPSAVIDRDVPTYGFDFEAGILAKQSLAHLY